jgi:hypothetical protein
MGCPVVIVEVVVKQILIPPIPRREMVPLARAKGARLKALATRGTHPIRIFRIVVCYRLARR